MEREARGWFPSEEADRWVDNVFSEAYLVKGVRQGYH